MAAVHKEEQVEEKNALLDPEDQPNDWDGGILMQKKVSNPDAVRQAQEIQLRCHMNPDFDTNASTLAHDDYP